MKSIREAWVRCMGPILSLGLATGFQSLIAAPTAGEAHSLLGFDLAAPSAIGTAPYHFPLTSRPVLLIAAFLPRNEPVACQATVMLATRAAFHYPKVQG